MIRWLLLGLLRLYRLILSPLFGPSCRFEPSCSRYASACIETHGAARGAYLATRRLLKCHPWHSGGYDPPPAARANSNVGRNGTDGAEPAAIRAEGAA